VLEGWPGAGGAPGWGADPPSPRCPMPELPAAQHPAWDPRAQHPLPNKTLQDPGQGESHIFPCFPAGSQVGN